MRFQPEGNWPVFLAILVIIAAAVLLVAAVLDMARWANHFGGS